MTVTFTTTGYTLVDSLMALALPPGGPDDTDHLLRNAAAGDTAAIERLLERHRERLRRMIALRLDDRLAARVDASDVVQEALADAARKLADYARDRPLPFYPVAAPPGRGAAGGGAPPASAVEGPKRCERGGRRLRLARQLGPAHG